jgi:hypothetical protein
MINTTELIKGMKYRITARGVTDVLIYSDVDEINNPLWRLERVLIL